MTQTNPANATFMMNGTEINGNNISISFPIEVINKELRPEKIIFNDRTTIVYWNDGSKSKSTRDINDTFDEKIGFASCLLKKLYAKKVHGKRLFDRMIEGAERHNIVRPNASTRLYTITDSTNLHLKKGK